VPASLDRPVPHHHQRPPAFACTTDDAYVRVAGELDIATAPQLASALASALSRSLAVVLDLHDVSFLDGAGTRAIVLASALSRAGDRQLVLLHGPPNVDRLFALTGTADQVVFVEPTVRDAGPAR
jgi:anti-anti-sigma factor